MKSVRFSPKSPSQIAEHLALTTVALLALSACSGKQSGGQGSSATATQMSSFDVNKFAINKLVCNPLGAGGGGSITNGLQATLYYKATSQSSSDFNKTTDFFNKGVRSEHFLFLNDINVPTRNFDTGFPTQANSDIVDDSGHELTEWFAMDMKSSIQLNYPNDGEGYYQLAVLSDDGATLQQLNADGTKSMLVSNDFLTPTRMGCGTKAIKMSLNNPIPIEYSYFQGPRYQIASVLMWRPVTDPNAPLDASCGDSGNYTFFNPDQGSAPSAEYNGLLSRGWKPLVTQNFNLGGVSGINPCVQGEVPVISNFTATEVAVGTVTFAWNTDIVATSQVLLLNEDNGSDTLTLADNTMTLKHSVTIKNIALGVNFMAQGVSISSTYGKALSTGYNFQEVAGAQ